MFKSRTKAESVDSFYLVFLKPLNVSSIAQLSTAQKRQMLHEATTAAFNRFSSEFKQTAESLLMDMKLKNNKTDSIQILSALACYLYKNEFENNITLKTSYLNKVLQLAAKDTIFYEEIKEAYPYLYEIYSKSYNFDSCIILLEEYKSIIHKNDFIATLSLYKIYANLYAKLEQYDQCIYYHTVYFELAKRTIPDTNRHILALIQIGSAYCNAYIDSGDYKNKHQALHYFERAMNYCKWSKETWQCVCYYYMGRMDYYEENYEKALASFQAVKAHYQPITENLIYGVANNTDIFLLLIRYKLGDESAITQLEKTPVESRQLLLNKSVQYELYQYWKSKLNFGKALTFFEKYKSINDSLDLNSNRNKFYALNQQKLLAVKESSIKALEIKNLKQGKMIIIYVLLLGVLVIIASSVYMIFYWRNKKKAVTAAFEKQSLLNKLHAIDMAHAAERETLQLEKNMIAMQQREEISKNMHDEISNGLAALRYYIADLKSTAQDSEAKELLATIESETSAIYIHTRNFMNQLRGIQNSTQHDVFSFLESLQMKFITDSSINIYVDADKNSLKQYLSADNQEALYYIIRESVVNCIKHSAATSIHIVIRLIEITCQFSITDNGRGMSSARVGEGMGLANMKTRINKLGGKMEINSHQKGTRVSGYFTIHETSQQVR